MSDSGDCSVFRGNLSRYLAAIQNNITIVFSPGATMLHTPFRYYPSMVPVFLWPPLSCRHQLKQACIRGPPKDRQRRTGRKRQIWLRAVEDDLCRSTSAWWCQGGTLWI